MPILMDQEIEEFFNAYVEAALWSTINLRTDLNDAEYLDGTNAEVADDTQKVMRADCDAFLRKRNAQRLIDKFANMKCAGHDFWLTRHHHGCGFWDRGEYPKAVGDLLTKYAQEFKEVDLWLGEDGLIHHD